MILRSELNAKNKITANVTLAVPVLRYSFGIINRGLEEIRNTDKKTTKALTMYKMHHSKADIDRLFVKRKEGRRGLLQMEVTYKAEISNISEYLNTKYTEDQSVNTVKSHESNQPNTNSINKVSGKVAEELNQSNENSDTKKEGIQHIKAKIGVLKEKMGKQINTWPVI